MTHLSLVELSRRVADGWGRFVAAAVHGEALSLPGGVLGMSGEPFSQMNTGFVTGSDGDAAAAALARFAERLRERRLPGVVFAASTVEAEAEDAARSLGLRRGGTLPLMCCRAADARRADADGYAVRLVKDPRAAHEAAVVLADAFGIAASWCEHLLSPSFPALPDAAMFVAYHGDNAVAVCGTARVGHTVGIYAVGTVQAHRRRGAAGAAVSGALDAHIGAGAHLFGLLSDPAVQGLYAAAGFAPVDVVTSWGVDQA